VLKPLNLFLVVHDQPILGVRPGSPMAAADLRQVAEAGGAILWDLLGDLRILPPNVIQDLWRSAQDMQSLCNLNSGLAVKSQLYFFRDQTVPMGSAVCGQLASGTELAPPSPQP
jgi:hypothetical protein